MRKLIVILLALILTCASLAGCGNQEVKDVQNSEPSTSSTDNTSSENTTNGGGITLAQIRKAAEDAGYNVYDDHQLVYMDDVVEGFTVQIVADNQDVRYSIIECKTEDAAIKNAKAIDDAGYNIAIRNEKILSCYGVDNKDGTGKDILASIVAGEPVANNKP